MVGVYMRERDYVLKLGNNRDYIYVYCYYILIRFIFER